MRKTLVARYKLQAIDTYDDMSIVWGIDGDQTVGNGLPGPMVFAAGFDDRYIVAAVHPYDFKGPPSKAVSEYYYVDRRFERDRPDGLPYRGINGPFDGRKFQTEKTRLKLPEFSWRNPED